MSFFRILSATATVLMMIASTTMAAGYGGGTGTASDPFTISTVAHILQMQTSPEDWSSHFLLTADIDLTGLIFRRAPIAPDPNVENDDYGGIAFTGSFDGNGRTISHLAVQVQSINTGDDCLGLFGKISSPGTVRNLTVANAVIETGVRSQYVGVLAGRTEGACVENCRATGSITCAPYTEDAGGLVGHSSRSTISGCQSDCTITTAENVSQIGGLVGSVAGGQVSGSTCLGLLSISVDSWRIGGAFGAVFGADIATSTSEPDITTEDHVYECAGFAALVRDSNVTDCNSAGTLTAGSRSMTVGGFAGECMDSHLTRCSATISVLTGNETDRVGGLAGVNRAGLITGCWSNGPVTCGINCDYVGGLIGSNEEDGAIIDCNSASTVSGTTNCDHTGGLVGANGYSGLILQCSASGDVQAEEEVGGLVGDNSGRVIHSYATGVVTGVYDADRLGGLVGRNEGSISLSYCTGRVTGGFNSDHLGGFAGRNTGNIAHCYATTSVTGGQDADELGGFVGYNAGDISFVYCSGRVTGAGTETTGAFAGIDAGGRIARCFWNRTLATISAGVGIQDVNQTTIELLQGLTTLEMIQSGPFIAAGWDFVGETQNGLHDIWKMPDDGGFPILNPANGYPPPLPGSGTAEEPYLISNVAELVSIAYLSKGIHCRLENDIDLGGSTWRMPVIAEFGGILEGDNHTISKLTMVGEGNSALIGVLQTTGRVMNLNVTDASVESTGGFVGILAGVNYGSVSLCHTTGTVTAGIAVGGLLGGNSGNLTDSFSTADVRGDGQVGGLAGRNNGIISYCYAAGTVGLEAQGDQIGGLVGTNWATVRQCCSTGDVSGDASVGGLVGENRHLVVDCYSRATVNARANVGGLAGYNDHGDTIRQCYSTGRVSGMTNVGPLVGYNAPTTGSYDDEYRRRRGYVIGCFWDAETSGQTTGHGAGLPTAEMQMQSTFTDAGWDFVDETANGIEDIWHICEGQAYPRLQWQIPSADLACPDGVTMIDFAVFADAWRSSLPDGGQLRYDLNGDGRLAAEDLAAIAGQWMSIDGIGSASKLRLYEDLAGYWTMDDQDADTMVIDSSGRGRDGSAQRNTFWLHTDGAVAGALTFDGSTDYIAVSDSDDWTLDGDFSVMLWVRFSQIKTTWWAAALIAHDEGPGQTNKWMFTYDAVNTSTLFHANAPATEGITVTGEPWTAEVDRWYHLGIVRSGDTYRFYKDGQVNGQVENTFVTGNAAADLTMGWAEGADRFAGALDEVMLYRRAVSGPELLAIYQKSR